MKVACIISILLYFNLYSVDEFAYYRLQTLKNMMKLIKIKRKPTSKKY